MFRDDHDAKIIGKTGSRYQLITPALVLDLDIMEENLSLMIQKLRAQGLALRANAKTHKCSVISRRQIMAGAIGVCCATIGEAEVMAAAGVRDILITTPMTTPQKMTAVGSLLQAGHDIMLAVDHVDNVRALDALFSQHKLRLKVLVDIDPGSKRTGAATDDAIIGVVKAVADSTSLDYRGVQYYAGFVQHIENRAEREQKNRDGLQRLSAIVGTLTAMGHKPDIVSGGGSGSFDMDEAFHVLTESQAGSFMFMDTQYNDVWHKDGVEPPFKTSLFVQTAVHSSSHVGFVTTDAGSKRFGMDGSRVVLSTRLKVETEYKTHGDEHGKIFFADGWNHLKIGDRVECIVPHCDPTINLYDRFYCVRGDTVVDIWSIDARGI